jgi:hypothetical protein
MDGGANPLMDRKVVGVVLFGVVAAWVNEILRKNTYFFNICFFSKNLQDLSAECEGRRTADGGPRVQDGRRTEDGED